MILKTERHKKYQTHRKNAKSRGIPWKITYLQWCLIWAKSGHWHERGASRDKYVMARFGDEGSYAPWNVKIILHSENSSEGLIGNKSWLGKKLSIEHRKKLSATKMGNKIMLGKKLSAKTRHKLSVSHKGKKFSVETRTNMSKAQKLRRQREAKFK